MLLPLVAAGELTYLAGLVSIPRFRAAIDAKVHAALERRIIEVKKMLASFQRTLRSPKK